MPFSNSAHLEFSTSRLEGVTYLAPVLKLNYSIDNSHSLRPIDAVDTVMVDMLESFILTFTVSYASITLRHELANPIGLILPNDL